MNSILKERELLYNLQVQKLYSKPELNGSAYVNASFKCDYCNLDLLSDTDTYKKAKRGTIIKKCPYCNKRFDK